MSVIIDVVKEEADRLKSLIKFYDDKIEEFPKGSISEKPRGNNVYCYLAAREGKRVRFDYVGPKQSEKVRILLLQIEQRKKYENLRHESQYNLKQVEKLLNASK